jgi:hypothetical protein
LVKTPWWEREPTEIDRENVAEAAAIMFSELMTKIDDSTKNKTLAYLTLVVL